MSLYRRSVAPALRYRFDAGSRFHSATDSRHRSDAENRHFVADTRSHCVAGCPPHSANVCGGRLNSAINSLQHSRHSVRQGAAPVCVRCGPDWPQTVWAGPDRWLPLGAASEAGDPPESGSTPDGGPAAAAGLLLPGAGRAAAGLPGAGKAAGPDHGCAGPHSCVLRVRQWRPGRGRRCGSSPDPRRRGVLNRGAGRRQRWQAVAGGGGVDAAAVVGSDDSCAAAVVEMRTGVVEPVTAGHNRENSRPYREDDCESCCCCCCCDGVVDLCRRLPRTTRRMKREGQQFHYWRPCSCSQLVAQSCYCCCCCGYAATAGADRRCRPDGQAMMAAEVVG